MDEVALVYRVKDAAGNEAQQRFDKQTVEEKNKAEKDRGALYHDSFAPVSYGGILAVLAGLALAVVVGLFLYWRRENAKYL